MSETTTGRYETVTTGGESYSAFIPDPLPPAEEILNDPQLIHLLEEANLAIGRLDGAASVLPDPHIFLYSYVRREAVLSSRIEGTKSSMIDLLSFEAGAMPNVPVDDVTEVSNYVQALNYATAQLTAQDGLPLCNRLLREAHGQLLRSGRGAEKMPGEFRTSQNWIGGPRPSLATFVPSPPEHLGAVMGQLESFIQKRDDVISPLLKAGLAHVQFETIHPFLDGNGRVGRMLIALILHDRKILRYPALYISLYIMEHRSTYYYLLDAVRIKGDWVGWLRFYLDCVAATAKHAAETAQQLRELVDRDRAKITRLGRSRGSALDVFQALTKVPAQNIAGLSESIGISVATVTSALERLCELGIVREITGKRRGRVFAYREYVEILAESR